MSLFEQQRPAANPEKLQQLKAWAHEALELPEDVPISISQLQCREPGCPPVETVITVMSQLPQTYNIHKAVDAVSQADVEQAVKVKPAEIE
ncbi:MAG: hypothetical protein ACFB4J_19615 [Elainellaceae cyanobacterium]